jgi:hypothetical protein
LNGLTTEWIFLKIPFDIKAALTDQYDQYEYKFLDGCHKNLFVEGIYNTYNKQACIRNHFRYARRN